MKGLLNYLLNFFQLPNVWFYSSFGHDEVPLCTLVLLGYLDAEDYTEVLCLQVPAQFLVLEMFSCLWK